MDSQILATFMSMVWAMEPQVLTDFGTIVGRKAAGVRVDVVQVNQVVAERDERFNSTELGRLMADGANPHRPVASDGLAKPFTVHGSTAIIPVTGVIAKYANQVNGGSQPRGTSVQAIRSMLAAARADAGVGSILLAINSPGGSVEGVADLADALYAMRSDSGKPVWAYGDSLAASAAYWIGSQASRFYAGRDTLLPSIGVYTVVVDSSRAYENEGIKVHLVASGGVKGSGVPGVAISPEALAKRQQVVGDFMELFGSSVSRARGFTPEQLAAVADGSTMLAPRAKAAGLIDDVRQLASVLDEMNAKFPAKEVARSIAGVNGSVAQQPSRLARLEERRTAVATFGAPAAQVEQASPGGDQSMNMKNLVRILRDPAPAVEPTGGGGTSISSILAAAGVLAVATATPPAAATSGTVDAVELARAAAGAAQSRVTEIMSIAKGFEDVPAVATLRDTALADAGFSVEKFRNQLLATVRDAKKPVPTTPAADVRIGQEASEKLFSGYEAVLVARLNPTLVSGVQSGQEHAKRLAIAAGYSDPLALVRAVDGARKGGIFGHRLIDIMASLSADKFSASRGRAIDRSNQMEVLAAGFGHATSDFPLLLANTNNKILLAAFSETPTTYERWCATANMNDFKTISNVSMSDLSDLQETAEGQPAKEGTFNEKGEPNALKTFTRKFSITRQMIINDDLSAITRLLTMFGVVASRVPERLAYKVLKDNAAMSDTVALFHATHGNLGAALALSQAAVETEYVNMRTQLGFGPDAAKLDIEPKVLLVPSKLKFTAARICNNATDVNGATANSNIINPLKGMLEPVDTPYLGAADGGSDISWYLVGDPRIAPAVQVGFLNGNRTPIVTQVGDGSILGINNEIVFDCCAAAVEHRGIRKNPGA